MAEHWQEVFTRNQQTRGIWLTHDAAFTVGGLTLAQHGTDGDALLTLANARDMAEDAVDDSGRVASHHGVRAGGQAA